jgi:hypothetical protein
MTDLTLASALLPTGGLPDDWGRDVWARIGSRVWNSDDARFFTPKAFGWGWSKDFYPVVHPRRDARPRGSGRAER